MITPNDLPDPGALVAVLSEEGAPTRLTLDIGGSADIDGDGIVIASLDSEGKLVLEDG